MKDFRNLLLDVRSALRRADRHFDNHPLRKTLDDALLELAKPEKNEEEERVQPETFTAQQVAYAWQIAARNLRITHPELHARMVERVNEMLDTDTLHDPSTEILKLQSQLESNVVAFQTEAAELVAIRKALAVAVPLTGRDVMGTESECAQRRLLILIAAASKGSGLPKPVTDDPNDMTHTREELEAVVAGQRELSRWERAWCVAEALVMTGKTTAQLQIVSDSDLVRMVLAGSSDQSPAS